ncbi:MAG TPA: hypothetical protein VN960_12000 [Gaiellaceae bacterium]|nr:hypothetical protein [Gaiellaceae bacterium]
MTTADSCTVPEYLDTHSPGPQTEFGYYEYQAWIASDASQPALDRLQRLVRSYFGLGEESGDSEALPRGLIGIALDHADETVNVVVDPSIVSIPDLTAAALAAVSAGSSTPPFKVAVRPGCFSGKELAAARSFLDALVKNRPAIAPHGWGFYLDGHDSTYHVGIDPADMDAATIFTSELGARVTIEVENGARLDRLNDGQPHWGAAGIRPGALSDNNCTSTFTFLYPTTGNLLSVTAGHCFTGTGAINGRDVFSGNEAYGGETSGAFDYPSYDMVRINNGGQTWDNKIHVDPCCPSVRTVVASGNPDVGDPICLSGMVTRAICGLEVRTIDGIKCDGGLCTIKLIRADRSGDIIARSGDSGGPMYNRSGDDNAAARGMINLGGDCTEVNFQLRCKIVYGHRISAITGHLDVTVATS